jgi:uncharacterized protein (DUF58 family)
MRNLWNAAAALTPATLRKKAGDLLSSVEAPPARTRIQGPPGENALRRRGHEGAFRQLRDYSPGDRIQDIDWRSAGRGDRLFVRERDAAMRMALDFGIEDSPGLAFRSDASVMAKRESGAVFALALALHAARRHDTLRFAGTGVDADALATKLLDAAPDSPRPGGTALQIVIGDFLSQPEGIERNFSGRQRLLLLRCLDPAERDLPFSGRAVFEDGTRRQPVGDIDRVREAYRARLDAHDTELAAMASRNRWHLETIVTGEDMTGGFRRCLDRISGATA